MKRIKLSIKVLMVPVLLGLLCCTVGSGCIMWWGTGHDHKISGKADRPGPDVGAHRQDSHGN